MPIRNAQDMVRDADAAVDTLTADEAVGLMNDDNTVFVDVRDSSEQQNAGTVPGAVHAPRGFLEFMADPASPRHVAALSDGKRLVVFCASGSRSALAAKTLKDMGYQDVAHVSGGFGALAKAGATR